MGKRGYCPQGADARFSATQGCGVVRAIEQVLAQGPRTRDLGGSASSREMGEAIAGKVCCSVALIQ
jgi:isocitrate/isopropylmalate dehydrogenase